VQSKTLKFTYTSQGKKKQKSILKMLQFKISTCITKVSNFKMALLLQFIIRNRSMTHDYSDTVLIPNEEEVILQYLPYTK
jgi:hypothetical protein